MRKSVSVSFSSFFSSGCGKKILRKKLNQSKSYIFVKIADLRFSSKAAAFPQRGNRISLSQNWFLSARHKMFVPCEDEN